MYIQILNFSSRLSYSLVLTVLTAGRIKQNVILSVSGVLQELINFNLPKFLYVLSH